MDKSFSLYHITRPSARKKNAPLLIMCHGYGSDEEDLFSFANQLPEELFIISVRAPITMQPYGNAWYTIDVTASAEMRSDNEQAKKARDSIATFIDEVIESYPVSSKNVTLLGFSQGAILNYGVALMYPEKVSNIIALSGYINTAILPENPLPENYKELHFYISHGTEDQVLPVSWARESLVYLKKLGINEKYSEFPVGHGVAPQNFLEMRDWLINRLNE